MIRGAFVSARPLVLAALLAWPMSARCQVSTEPVGAFLVEHTAVLTGQFSNAEVALPVPLNWPTQTVSDLTLEPEDAELILDESKAVYLAVLRVEGPASRASLTLRYKVQCRRANFDKAVLASHSYAPYDPDDDLFKRFTAPATRIESDDPGIASLGKQLAAQEPNPYLRARLIYDTVIDRSSFRDEQAHGAKVMFERRIGCCADYSMLFVALCRAAGIPARECSGYIAGKADKWHSWAEFRLPDIGWVPCDPQTGDEHDAARERQFAGLGGSAMVAVAKRHDFTVRVGDATRVFPFIQSGSVRYRGDCRRDIRLTFQDVSTPRYCALLRPSGGRRMVRVDLSESGFLAADEEAKAKGLQCISVTLAPGPPGPTYAAIWGPAPQGRTANTYPRLSRRQYESLLNQAKQDGMMPISLASCAGGGAAIYAAVFTDGQGHDWSAVTGLSRDAFTSRLRAEMHAQCVPTSIAIHQEGGRSVCSAVFMKLSAPAAVQSGLWSQQEEFDARLAGFQTGGYTPVAVAVTAGRPALFHTVAIDDGRRRNWRVIRASSGAELERTLAAARSQGLDAASISAY